MESQATQQRRNKLRTDLIKAAEQQIAAKGLETLTARALAREVGCSVGAIYNVFEDLDGLIIAVNSRTLARLDRQIAKSTPLDAVEDDPEECLVGLSAAYCQFAVEHTHLWSALFEHAVKSDRRAPDWHMDEHVRLIAHIVGALRVLTPEKDEEALWSLAGLLFSSVHGVVSLGLQGFFFAAPISDIRIQVETLVRATLRGITTPETTS